VECEIFHKPPVLVHSQSIRCVGNHSHALVHVVCDFSKISTFPILSIHEKLMGISCGV
jgi:hypothetical protein